MSVSEVINSYNWFAPICQCTHEDGTFKGIKMLACRTIFCKNRILDTVEETQEEANKE